jgi:ribosomal protein S18 acetylase RimI-like enzyme
VRTLSVRATAGSMDAPEGRCVTTNSGSTRRSVTAGHGQGGVVAFGVVTSQPADVTYRDATDGDVETIVDLVHSAYRGESSRVGWTTEADLLDGQRTDADAVRAIVASNRTRLLLAVAATGAVLGCCQLERRDHGVCYFGMFAVSPVLQGSGLGRGLLAEAERVAHDEWGARSMKMTVITQRRDLIAWYERRGYSTTGETEPFPHGDDRFGLPRRDDLAFEVLTKPLG